MCKQQQLLLGYSNRRSVPLVERRMYRWSKPRKNRFLILTSLMTSLRSNETLADTVLSEVEGKGGIYHLVPDLLHIVHNMSKSMSKLRVIAQLVIIEVTFDLDRCLLPCTVSRLSKNAQEYSRMIGRYCVSTLSERYWNTWIQNRRSSASLFIAVKRIGTPRERRIDSPVDPSFR